MWCYSVERLDDGGGALALADTGAIDDLHSDVATLAPGSTPGVADEPVVLAGGGVSAVSDGGDSVVNTGGAASAIEDTTSVGGEAVVASADGNGGGALVNGSLHG